MVQHYPCREQPVPSFDHKSAWQALIISQINDIVCPLIPASLVEDRGPTGTTGRLGVYETFFSALKTWSEKLFLSLHDRWNMLTSLVECRGWTDCQDIVSVKLQELDTDLRDWPLFLCINALWNMFSPFLLLLIEISLLGIFPFLPTQDIAN